MAKKMFVQDGNVIREVDAEELARDQEKAWKAFGGLAVAIPTLIAIFNYLGTDTSAQKAGFVGAILVAVPLGFFLGWKLPKLVFGLIALGIISIVVTLIAGWIFPEFDRWAGEIFR